MYEIETIWARAIDKVSLKVSINKGKITEPYSFDVRGEETFSVGGVYSFGPTSFRIKKIKLRDGRFLSREGESVKAYRIKRVFASSVGW